MSLEIYSRIKDFDNYAVSNFGNVINILTGRTLKPSKKCGYCRVVFSKDNIKYTKTVHRLVACQFLDKIEGKELVDHIDNCKTNNRLDNLRFCNKIENGRNSKLNSNSTSGVKGISYAKNRKKWEASICLNKNKIHIGYYDNLEEAKIARQHKSRELFQEFQNACEK